MDWAHRKIELGRIKLVENLWRKQPPTIMTNEEIKRSKGKKNQKERLFFLSSLIQR